MAFAQSGVKYGQQHTMHPLPWGSLSFFGFCRASSWRTTSCSGCLPPVWPPCVQRWPLGSRPAAAADFFQQPQQPQSGAPTQTQQSGSPQTMDFQGSKTENAPAVSATSYMMTCRHAVVTAKAAASRHLSDLSQVLYQFTQVKSDSSGLPEGNQWRYSEFIEAVQRGKVERVRFAKDGTQLQLTAVDGGQQHSNPC